MSETAAVHHAILSTIDKLSDEGDEPGAPAGDVIEDVLEEVDQGIGHVCNIIQELHTNGEIYQPEATTVRRTSVDAAVAPDGGTDRRMITREDSTGKSVLGPDPATFQAWEDRQGGGRDA